MIPFYPFSRNGPIWPAGGAMDKFVALRFILGQNKAHIWRGLNLSLLLIWLIGVNSAAIQSLSPNFTRKYVAHPISFKMTRCSLYYINIFNSFCFFLENWDFAEYHYE